MGRRTSTAKWMDKYKRWQINVQKHGERKSFYSSTPGRTGQRECNSKADAWLDDNISPQNKRISELFDEYVDSLKLTTSKSNWIKIEAFGKNWIKPNIGMRKMEALSEQMLQNIINQAFATGLAKKTLMNLRATIIGFIKFCRKSNYTTLFPEDLTIPKSARVSSKRILQPSDLAILFSKDKITMYGKEQKDELINAYRFQILTGLRPR